MSLPPLNVTALLKAHGLHPKKSLGQNFLIDDSALRRVVNAAEIDPDDEVLEIGAGLGSLTRHLALSARRVVAVELDGNLLAPLEQTLGGFENVTIVHGDMLRLDPAKLVSQPGYLVVANIPYYITSALIRHLLEASVKPARIVLTVQKEVAQRIVAADGKMSLLALSVHVFGAPRTAGSILAGSFYPAPEVDSSVVRVDLYPEPLIATEKLEAFFRLAKAGFSQKRKTLRNALSATMRWSTQETEAKLNAAGIDPQRRAETVNLAEWGKLVEVSEG